LPVSARGYAYGRTRFPDRNLVCIGHSSGAHISALALLGIHDASSLKSAENVPLCDVFIAQAGVYDIAAHFLYESARGVALVSPLLPASCLNGVPDPAAMDNLSPLWHVQQTDFSIDSGGKMKLCLQGLDLEGAASASFLSSALLQPASRATKSTKSANAKSDCRAPLSSEDGDPLGYLYPVHFPVTYIQAAVADSVVPTTGALHFYSSLAACGGDATLLLYEGEMSHGDFVTDWLTTSGMPSRELRRQMLDIDSADAEGRARVDRHVFGEEACTVERLGDAEFRLGPAAHARDCVRILNACCTNGKSNGN
jgi:acetyl esterase/lipase